MATCLGIKKVMEILECDGLTVIGLKNLGYIKYDFICSKYLGYLENSVYEFRKHYESLTKKEQEDIFNKALLEGRRVMAYETRKEISKTKKEICVLKERIEQLNEKLKSFEN